MPYCAVADVKAYLDSPDTSDDTLLTSVISRVSSMGLRDMRPTFARDDVADGGAPDTELYRQLLLGHQAGSISRANGSYLPIGEFGVRRLFSAGHSFGVASCGAAFAGSGSPLRYHVSDVGCLSISEQMSWVDAKRRIAGMADVHTVWYRPVGQFKTDPMSFEGSAAASASQDSTVVIRRSADPQPARPEFGAVRRDGAVLIHFGPKTLIDGGAGILSGHQILQWSGVALRAAATAPEPFVAPNYTIYHRHSSLTGGV